MGIRIASDKVDKFTRFRDFANSDSAVLFVADNIVAAISAYENFVSKLNTTNDKDLFRIEGGVLDGKVLTPADVLSIKTLPTKKESIKRLAIMLKKTPTKTASIVKIIQTKLARAVQKISELDEDQSKLVVSFEGINNIK